MELNQIVTYSGPAIATTYFDGVPVEIPTGARGVVTDPARAADGFAEVQFEKGRVRLYVDPATLAASE